MLPPVSGVPTRRDDPPSDPPVRMAPHAVAGALATLSGNAPALVAAAAGLAWFALHVGVAALDPTRTGWLMSGDWAANYLGWAFFRHAPLALPLGANPGFPFPVGSTLSYSDSLPLVGVLLRPLSPLLPVDFQYVGPWLGLCFALQGFVGAKLVRLATEDRLAQALGGALAALALLAFGYLDRGIATTVGGFGFFSTDALSLVVPMGWSRALPGPALGRGQYEGFGYLG